ncbi:RNase H-like domain found in reverse transcriptase [Popillia japonica]|uniref:RNase H-like domain found in reverse transcriptase n=1 Tax=Popillia japonica TaxID=7064 RepID=A0AAW1IVG6_POPJA
MPFGLKNAPTTFQKMMAQEVLAGYLRRRIITYASSRFNATERRYHINEQECLAVIWAIKRFRPYLEDRKFTLRTDSRALLWLDRTKTIRTIESRFFWSTLRKDVRTYVRACPICTCYKRGPQQGAAPMRPHQPTRPFEVVSCPICTCYKRGPQQGAAPMRPHQPTRPFEVVSLDLDRNFDLRYGRKR